MADLTNDDAEARVQAVKDTYGDNHWWDSDDLRTLGYYQMQEPILILPFQQFHAAAEFLLQRPIWTHEFGLNAAELRAEAQAAWDGQPYSDAQKAAAVGKGFALLGERLGDKLTIVFDDDDEGD